MGWQSERDEKSKSKRKGRDEEKVKRLHVRDGSVEQKGTLPPRGLPGTSSLRFLLVERATKLSSSETKDF